MKKTKRIVLFSLISCVMIFVASRLLDVAICGTNTYAGKMIDDLYNTEENIDVMFCGSSLSYCAYDPAVYDSATGDYSFDLAYSGAAPIDNYYLLKEALTYNKPKLVIFEVSPSRLSMKEAIQAHGFLTDNIRLSANRIEALQNMYSNILDGIFAGRRVPINELMIENLLGNIQSAIAAARLTGDQDTAYAGRGQINFETSFKDGFVAVNSGFSWSEESILPKNQDYFERTIKLCQEQGIGVIAVFPPTLHPFMLRHVEAFQNFDRWMKAFAEQQNILYWDGNLLRFTCYPRVDTDYIDTHHMGSGSTRYTAIIAEMVQAYYNGTFQENDYFYADYDELCAAQTTTADAWLTAEENESVITLHANALGSQNADFQFSFSISRDDGVSFQPMPEAQNDVCAVPKTDTEKRIIKMEAVDRNDATQRVCYATCTIDENGGFSLQ